MKFKTDLNERERRRYSKQLAEIGNSARGAATALEKGNDEEFFMNFLLFSIQQMGVRELLDVINDSMVKNRSEFPDLIGEK